MKFLNYATSLPLTWLALGCSAAQPPLAPRAIALKPAPLAVMPKAQAATLCARVATPCNPETTQAWIGAPSSWASALFIDTARPLLMVIRPDGSLAAWDFASYRHTRSPSDGAAGNPLEIYPALYPASGNTYAIAVVRAVSEGYSGGGASFSYADFVALNTTPLTAPSEKPYTLLYAGVPFSCSKMVRACFSEREYQTSRHCHEQWDGHLTLRFPSAHDSAARWSFTWHETHWPAHVTQAHTKRTQTRFTLPAGAAGINGALPKGVALCGGGPP